MTTFTTHRLAETDDDIAALTEALAHRHVSENTLGLPTRTRVHFQDHYGTVWTALQLTPASGPAGRQVTIERLPLNHASNAPRSTQPLVLTQDVLDSSSSVREDIKSVLEY